METTSGLWLPPGTTDLLGDADLARHEEFAAIPYEKFATELDEIELQTHGNNSDTKIQHALLRAKDGGDTRLILPLPFANGLSIGNYIMARYLQHMSGDQMDVDIFPNQAYGYPEYYWFARGLQGDALRRLAQLVLCETASQGVDEIIVAGKSQAADVGAAMYGENQDMLEIKGALLCDPATGISRPRPSLLVAMMRTGVDNFTKAVNDSGLPALSQALNTGSETSSIQQSLAQLNYARGTLLYENRELYDALCKQSFWSNLEKGIVFNADGSDNVPMVPFGVRSRMFTTQAYFNGVAASRKRGSPIADMEAVETYGHEVGENLGVVAGYLLQVLRDSRVIELPMD